MSFPEIHGRNTLTPNVCAVSVDSKFNIYNAESSPLTTTPTDVDMKDWTSLWPNGSGDEAYAPRRARLRFQGVGTLTAPIRLWGSYDKTTGDITVVLDLNDGMNIDLDEGIDLEIELCAWQRIAVTANSISGPGANVTLDLILVEGGA